MNSMPQRRRPSPEWSRIRQLFLGRRASYDPMELPGLLGIEPAAVREALERGTIAAGSGAGDGVPWEDVVALGLEHRWTYRMLAEALRGRAGAALPRLVRAVSGRVVLPRYQWEILRFLAARQAREQGREITASDLLEEAVSLAVVTRTEDWRGLEASLPGVAAAAAWPSPE